MTRYGTPAGDDGERGRLYAGPRDGALVRISRAGAGVIRVDDELYQRTTAVDRDGRPIFHHAPSKEPRK